MDDQIACPFEDLVLLIAWIEDHRREKARWQHSQYRVLLHEDSHFWVSIETKCLKSTAASLPIPLVIEANKGVNVEMNNFLNSLFICTILLLFVFSGTGLKTHVLFD